MEGGANKRLKKSLRELLELFLLEPDSSKGIVPWQVYYEEFLTLRGSEVFFSQGPCLYFTKNTGVLPIFSNYVFILGL